MKKFTLVRALSATTALLLALLVGGASSPASSQDDGDDDAEECTADAITLEDGILCLHGLECETLEAGKLCFKMG